MVILPGVSTVAMTRAPFSSVAYVCVSPDRLISLSELKAANGPYLGRQQHSLMPAGGSAAAACRKAPVGSWTW